MFPKTFNFHARSFISILACVMLLLLVAACGGGGSGNSTGPNDSIPSVNQIPRRTIFRNETLVSALSSEFYEVRSHSQPLQGTVIFDKNAYTYTPNKDFVGLDRFEIIALSKSINELRRIHVEINISSWSESAALETKRDGKLIQGLDNGQSLVIWRESEIVTNLTSLWSAVYDVDLKFTTPELVSNVDIHADDPKISLNSLNEGMLVWEEASPDAVRNGLYGPPFTLVSRKYQPGAGWASTTQTIVKKTLNLIRIHDLDVDEKGNAVIVWQERMNNDDQLWSSIYQNGNWGVPTRLDTSNDTNYAQVKMQDINNILVVWQEPYYDTSTIIPSIVARHYDSSGIWGEQLPVSSMPDYQAVKPNMAMNASGEAVVVWQQDLPFNVQTYVSHFSSASKFATPFSLHPNLYSSVCCGDDSTSKVAVLSDNQFIAVWHHSSKVYSHVYDSVNGWSDAIEVGDIEFGVPLFMDIDLQADGAGNAIAAWQSGNYPASGVQKIWTNRFIAGKNWRTASLIDTDKSSLSDYSIIDMDFNASGYGYILLEDTFEDLVQDYKLYNP